MSTPKKKDPIAAIKRAVDAAAELTAEDRKTLLGRLKTGEPKMGLVNMAYVEAVAAELGGDDKAYLIAKIEKLA